MEDNRTHIIHERTDEVRRTLGYRVVSSEGGNLKVLAAEARCHPNDNFNRKVARSIVDTRLRSALDEGKRHRVFEAEFVNTKVPTNSTEWRELEQSLILLSDLRLPSPAALQA